MEHPYKGEIKPCPFCGNQPGHYNLHDSLHPTGMQWYKSPSLDIHCFGEDLDIKHSHHSPTQLVLEKDITERGMYWTFNCLESEFGCGASLIGYSMEEVMQKWNRRVPTK